MEDHSVLEVTGRTLTMLESYAFKKREEGLINWEFYAQEKVHLYVEIEMKIWFLTKLNHWQKGKKLQKIW